MPEASAPPFIAALVSDLFFAIPVRDAITAAGARPLMVEDPASLADAFESWPALVLIDIAVPGDWQAVVKRAKNLPHTRHIPIVAFGSHVDAQALQAARLAGCDYAWPRGRFVKDLPRLLRDTLHPSPAQLEGCDETPPELLRQGIAQFNSGAYWECHETLETLWRSEARPVRDLYQGILQVGVAFHHLGQHNQAGALKCLRRGLPRLRALPARCQGVPVAELSEAALRVHDRLVALGAERISEFDLAALPKIELAVDSPQPR